MTKSGEIHSKNLGILIGKYCTVSSFIFSEYQSPRRPSQEAVRCEADQEGEDDVDVLPSLSAEAGKSRLIESDDLVLGGRNAASQMEHFMPTRSLRGLEDIVEEAEYYDSYQKVGLLLFFPQILKNFKTLFLHRSVTFPCTSTPSGTSSIPSIWMPSSIPDRLSRAFHK